MTLHEVIELGFDGSSKNGKFVRIRCSQCEAVFINGIPCHETGCPHTRYACKGCDTILDYNGYCEDCS